MSTLFSKLLKFFGLLVLIFAALQFVRPDLQNRAPKAEIQAPEEVKQILKHSCYDCHSTESKLAWFDLPVPAYWLVIRDIREARKHINFSEIGALPLGQQKAALYEGLFQVQHGAMPLPAYRRLHAGTALTDDQITTLKRYLAQPSEIVPSSPAEIQTTESEFERWAANANSLTTNVAPEPNGLTFPSDYKNWIAISSTDRFDNHTIRQILANSVALKAIANSQTNPWPDGSAFAKVAWHQLTSSTGVVRPGTFYQVEFMVHDSKNHAGTLGWAWSRWRGNDLKPYGEDAHFYSECVGCHRPLKTTDYLFTTPIQLASKSISNSASTSELPTNPLAWRTITSEIDRPHSTMSTLYGNDTAVDYARTHKEHDYPPGSILALITWQQKPDERWFGANIPAIPVAVEFLTIQNDSAGKPTSAYQRFEGSPLHKFAVDDAFSKERSTYLASLRAAVMP